ncbi:hypothetical protein MRX96_045017 [Rhipicephalus microplus]
MVDKAMAQFDCQDPDTEDFLHKGLQAMYKEWDGARLKSALMKYGSCLSYEEELSDKDAAMASKIFQQGFTSEKSLYNKDLAQRFQNCFPRSGGVSIAERSFLPSH